MEKICLSNDSIKICNRTIDDCVGCIPGHLKTVKRMTGTELMELAGSNAEQVLKLSSIIEELRLLYKKSRLGESNKNILYDQLQHLGQLGAEMSDSGSTLFFNLMYTNRLSMSPEEESVHSILTEYLQ